MSETRESLLVLIGCTMIEDLVRCYGETVRKFDELVKRREEVAEAAADDSQ